MPSLTRTVLAAVVGCGLVAGCGKPAGSAKPARANAVAGDTGGSAPDAGPDAAGAVKEFLAAVQAGTAKPEQLTAAFKRVIAEPVFPSDKEKGYSDAAAADWLGQFKGKVGSPVTGTAGGGDAVVVTGAADGRHLCLRAVRDGGSWKIDWFSAAAGGPYTSTLPGGDAAYPAFAGVAFLDALFARDDRLAEGLLTPKLKAALAPPLGADPRGFNRTLLAQRLADLRGGFTGYAVESTSGPTVAATRTGPDGAKKKLTLTLARGDKPWEYRVDEIAAE